MVRVLIVALPFYRDDWRPVVWVLAIASMVIGSTLAVVQTNVKRLLAYSSISHAGYILVGLEAAAHQAGEADAGPGVPSIAVYLLAYTVLVVGSFGVVALVSRQGDDATDLDSFRGLARRRPVLAVMFTVFLLAQAGVPFTSGFIAKFGVIQAAVDERSYAIAIVAMLAAVIAAFLYLRIMVSVWISDPADDESVALAGVHRPSFTGLVGVGLAATFTIARRSRPELAARCRRHRHAVRPLIRRRHRGASARRVRVEGEPESAAAGDDGTVVESDDLEQDVEHAQQGQAEVDRTAAPGEQRQGCSIEHEPVAAGPGCRRVAQVQAAEDPVVAVAGRALDLRWLRRRQRRRGRRRGGGGCRRRRRGVVVDVVVVVRRAWSCSSVVVRGERRRGGPRLRRRRATPGSSSWSHPAGWSSWRPVAWWWFRPAESSWCLRAGWCRCREPLWWNPWEASRQGASCRTAVTYWWSGAWSCSSAVDLTSMSSSRRWMAGCPVRTASVHRA